MNRELRQLVGFILFWIAVGMLFMVFIKSSFAGVMLAFVLLIAGYLMFTDFHIFRHWK